MSTPRPFLSLFVSLSAFSAGATNDPPCFFSEHFDGPGVPVGWSIGPQVEQLDASGNGLGTFVDAWTVGDADVANAQGNFPAPHRFQHGSFIMANDDATVCDCDMSNVALTTPTIDLTGHSSTVLECAVFLDQAFGGGMATIEASTDGSVWLPLASVAGGQHAWQSLFIDLDAFDGTPALQLRFTWTDNGQWAAGFALDDVCIYDRPASIDLVLVDVFTSDVTLDPFDQSARGISYRQLPLEQCVPSWNAAAVVMNRGTSTLDLVSCEVHVGLDMVEQASGNGTLVTSLAPGQRDTILIDLGWIPSVAGNYIFAFTASQPLPDGVPFNELGLDSLLVTGPSFDQGYSVMSVDRGASDGSVGVADDKFSAGARFELEGSGSTVYGLRTRFDNATEEGALVRARLMDGLLNEIAASEVIEVTAADLWISFIGATVFIPFTEPEASVTGDVFALIESIPDSGAVRIAASGAAPYGVPVLLKGQAEAVSWISRTPVVRLALSEQHVGVEEPLPAAYGDLSVFPSPTAGNATLLVPHGTGPDALLRVLDASGRVVGTRSVDAGVAVLDLPSSTWAEGIYLLDLRSASGRWTGRLVVAR